MSFYVIINKVQARSYALRPLSSAADPTVHNPFMESEPYGVMCWFRGRVILGLQQIARRFKNRSPSVANEKCFVPLEHTQIRQSFEIAEATINAKLQEHLIVGESASVVSHAVLSSYLCTLC